MSPAQPPVAYATSKRSSTRRVPYHMAFGAHEARGRAVLANEWFELLNAPTQGARALEHSGHRPQFEEPREFAALMRRVLNETKR